VAILKLPQCDCMHLPQRRKKMLQQNAFACGWLVTDGVCRLHKIGVIRLIFVTTKVRMSGLTNVTRHSVSTNTCWHFAFRLCCYSSETHTPIANPPNSAQLWGTPYHYPNFPKLHPGPCSSVGIRRGTDRQTDTHTQTRVTTTHFVSSTTHAKCNNN